ncbi:hypothetical protein F2Q69_00046045 [Brassica cretica]|uniref:Uncharacterized protein n=1 Tax=Brassica cretica TaxID=69181 RepID=A0A8S9PJ68_BRACR|nr:hypothetical protein F2Q69_00046045 [Brassica cretica]
MLRSNHDAEITMNQSERKAQAERIWKPFELIHQLALEIKLLSSFLGRFNQSSELYEAHLLPNGGRSEIENLHSVSPMFFALETNESSPHLHQHAEKLQQLDSLRLYRKCRELRLIFDESDGDSSLGEEQTPIMPLLVRFFAVEFHDVEHIATVCVWLRRRRDLAGGNDEDEVIT